LREELRLKDHRIAQIPPQRRPHYGPMSAWRFSSYAPPAVGR
jgi:hypothetical protein